jgi:hypothetical protein
MGIHGFAMLLDQHAYTPEPEGMWIAGTGRAEILVRSVFPVHHFRVTAASPIRTTFTVSAGAGPRRSRSFPALERRSMCRREGVRA